MFSRIFLIFLLISQQILYVSYIDDVELIADRPKIAAINDVLKSLIEEAFGDLVYVFSILPPGVDPHTFSLTPDIIDKVSKSDLIVLVDPRYFGLEAAIISNDELSKIPYLYAANYSTFGWRYISIPGIKVNFHGAWLDIINALSIVKAVGEFLAKKYPEEASKFISRVEKFNIFASKVLNYLNNISEKLELFRWNAIVALPSVSYVLSMLNISIIDYLMLEPDEYPSYSKISRLRNLIKDGEVDLIVVPEEFRNSRVSQLVEEISSGSNIRITYVYVFTATDFGSYTNLILYDVGEIAFSQSVYGEYSKSGDLLYLYILIGILLIISILEGLVIFLYKKEESEGF